MAKTSAPTGPDTLAIDVGGTGLKASIVDSTGKMEAAKVRIDTPYPLSPQKLVEELVALVRDLPPYDRVSLGFPGMIRNGRVLSAPHFVCPGGPGGTPAPKLVKAWGGFDLEGALAQATGKPTKVANDADVQGSAVVEGKGFEAVITLGTGVGTAFFLEGKLMPHFEFAHHPLGKAGTYNDYLGNAALKQLGLGKWQRRVVKAIATFKALTFYDHLFVGGGNSVRLRSLVIPDDITLVDNSAGIIGGIKLWERS